MLVHNPCNEDNCTNNCNCGFSNRDVTKKQNLWTAALKTNKNDRLWNVSLYDVIVWINTASAEEDQRLLLHRCLFSPAPRFAHVVQIREANVGLRTYQTIKITPNTKRSCAVSICGKTQHLHRLPSDLNVRKEWMNFIFNEVSDHVSKNLVLCSFYRVFVYKQCTMFSERLKQKDDAVSTIFDLTIM